MTKGQQIFKYLPPRDEKPNCASTGTRMLLMLMWLEQLSPEKFKLVSDVVTDMTDMLAEGHSISEVMQYVKRTYSIPD